MKLFDIDYRKLPTLLLPTFLRKPVIVSLLHIVSKELDTSGTPGGVYYRFVNQRKENLFYLRYNGQVCHLRAALNDHFFGTVDVSREEGFEIEGAVSTGNWLFVYLEKDEIHDQTLLAHESETAEVESTVKPKWIYKEKDIEAVTTGFTVRYPYDKIEYVDGDGSTKNKERYDKMEKLVNYFRLVSREPDYKPKYN